MDSLADTVEAFIELQNITKFATQSWAAVHRSLSSALLLGILGEPVKNERARTLLTKLITVISEAFSGVDPSEMSAPLSRSIAALQKMEVHETPVQSTTISPILQSFVGGFEDLSNPVSVFISGSTASLSPQLLYSSGDEPSPYSLLNTIIWGAGSSADSLLLA
jgi:hypothetical protein